MFSANRITYNSFATGTYDLCRFSLLLLSGYNLENIEDGVNDDDDSPSSRNEDVENVELASEGLNVDAPLTCIAEKGGSTRRGRGKTTNKGLSASVPGSLDFGSSPTVSAFRNKCKEVERLQGKIADAYAAFDD